ncbi:pilin [Pseudomonas typographi]|uniref:Pilin n=1 Tax=Pseudomonas typographi TaxID=2715964 RepID=A0ABR7YX67_9PSED|nr:pilin [Pseudomonas typographi]MBD1586321.1 pilin [Pseudomonas typographi]MBD1597793.1 pilin [Pseudomonas typographi]
MNTPSSGFSLIELMVVVAIIGILSSIALPAYSAYQARSKLAAGMAESAALRTLAEDTLNSGAVIGSEADLPGITRNSQHCIFTASFAADGAGRLACAIQNAPPSVSNATLVWARTAQGDWACSATAVSQAHLLPQGCPAQRAP